MSISLRVFEDAQDGAITFLPDGRVSYPSDVADSGAYLGALARMLDEGVLVRRGADVQPGLATLAGAGVA